MAKIGTVATAVRQPAIVKDLQKQVPDIRMRFFKFI